MSAAVEHAALSGPLPLTGAVWLEPSPWRADLLACALCANKVYGEGSHAGDERATLLAWRFAGLLARLGFLASVDVSRRPGRTARTAMTFRLPVWDAPAKWFRWTFDGDIHAQFAHACPPLDFQPPDGATRHRRAWRRVAADLDEAKARVEWVLDEAEREPWAIVPGPFTEPSPRPSAVTPRSTVRAVTELVAAANRLVKSPVCPGRSRREFYAAKDRWLAHLGNLGRVRPNQNPHARREHADALLVRIGPLCWAPHRPTPRPARETRQPRIEHAGPFDERPVVAAIEAVEHALAGGVPDRPL